MHRVFFPDTPFLVGESLRLPAEASKHLQTVLRLAAGSECELFDGRGCVASAKLLPEDFVEILQVVKLPPPRCRLSLIQGLPKGEKLELVLQKGTELGVNCFIPTRMSRSVGQVKKDRQAKRLLRWNKIVQEAARQSGQAFLPAVQLQADFVTALQVGEADLKLLLWEESEQSLQELLPKQAPQSITVVVGPEGGISREEAETAIKSGFQSVSLGPRILRTETAGLAIMTILQYLYGDLAKGRCSN
jgi:16S rRNA (uracil1498-N3)-methyltransferase